MPEAFMNCMKRGGKVRTLDLPGNKYIHLCSLNGKTHEGEVMTKKADGSCEAPPSPAQAGANLDKAQAAQTLTKIEIVSDGTRAGTVIKLNGQPIDKLLSLSFRFYNDDYPDPCVCMDFTTGEQDVQRGEFRELHSFSLRPHLAPSPSAVAAAGQAPTPAQATIEQMSKIPPGLEPRGNYRFSPQYYARM